jgi:hypothetical protein
VWVDNLKINLREDGMTGWIGLAQDMDWRRALMNMAIRGVGCMDVKETLLPYRNATNIFLRISKKIFILQNIN